MIPRKLTPAATLGAALAAAMALTAPPAAAGETEAKQACLYEFQRSGEQNTGAGGRIARAHRSDGAWDIVIMDQAETPWDCRAHDNGYVEYLRKDSSGGAGHADGGRDKDKGGKDQDKGSGGDERWGEETHAARQACREAVRERSGRGGISIRRVEYSEANTLVVLDDEGEKGSWRCLSSSRGKVAELTFSRD